MSSKRIKSLPKVRIPASKSHTIRALLIAAFATGESRLNRVLVSRDTLSCRQAIEALGASVREDGTDWIVTGFGSTPEPKHGNIDVKNSGTTLYLSTALAALATDKITFDGDKQIRRRSASPLLDALSSMGVQVSGSNNGCAPFSVQGPLQAGEINVDCPVSQYLSALLMAAPLISGKNQMKETLINIESLNEAPYVTITLDWLDFQGIHYQRDNWNWFRIPAGQKYNNYTRTIPGDWSSASFFLAAAAVTQSTLDVLGVDTADSQGDKAVLDMLYRMGCLWEEIPEGIRIHGSQLKGGVFDLNATPDALPIMAVTACFAEGETRLENVPQARMKETDRISVMSSELRKLGATVRELPDGMIIQGKKTALKAIRVDGHDDHRVVMALAVAGLGCEGHISIQGAEAVDVTFPDFFDLLKQTFG